VFHFFLTDNFDAEYFSQTACWLHRSPRARARPKARTKERRRPKVLERKAGGPNPSGFHRRLPQELVGLSWKSHN